MRAVITDSTWSLPETLAEALHINVIPLHVTADRGVGHTFTHGATTSQPSAGELAAALEAADGEEISCIHLSAQLSGTVTAMARSAREYQERTGVPVTVIDTRTTGAALGYCAAVAAATLLAGGPQSLAIARARECAARSRVTFTVPDLKHLQRGGRLAAPKALIGAALGIRTVLEIREGAIRLKEPVRGAARALRAVAEGAVHDLPPGPVSLAVHHVAAPEDALVLAQLLRQAAIERGSQIERLDITQMPAVLAAHAGPGALAAVSAPTFGLLPD